MHCNIGPHGQSHCNCTKTGCFPPTPAARGDRAAPVSRSARTCRSSARTATPIRSGSPGNAPFTQRDRAAARARPLPVPDALQPGRRSRRARRRLAPRPVARRSARRVAPVRGATFTCSAARRRALWLNYVFAKVFGLEVRLDADTADHYFDAIGEKLAQDGVPAARAVRALQHRGARDDRVAGRHARCIIARSASSGWSGRVITAYRPDAVIDPEHEAFAASLRALRRADRRGRATRWRGYLERAPQAPRGLREGGRDLDRSRPSDRARPPICRAAKRSAVRTRDVAGNFTRGRRRAVPRGRC